MTIAGGGGGSGDSGGIILPDLERLLIPPDEDGYSFSNAGGFLYVETDGGLPRTRADIIDSNLIVGVKWKLDEDEYQYLCQFYQANLAADSEPFLCELLIDDSVTEWYQCIFVKNTFKLDSNEAETWFVSATLEVWIPDATVEEYDDEDEGNSGIGETGEGYYPGSNQTPSPRHISVQRGLFTLSGKAATPRRLNRSISADRGLFVFSGQVAYPGRYQALQLGTGMFALNGQAVALIRSKHLDAATGMFTLSGQSTVDPFADYRLSGFTSGTGVSISDSGRLVTRSVSGSSSYGNAWTNHILTGKSYWEMEVITKTSTLHSIGLGLGINTGVSLNSSPWHGVVLGSGGCGLSAGLWADGSFAGAGAYVFDVGDRIGFAYDATTRKLWIRRNGTFGGNPVSGAGEDVTLTVNSYVPSISIYDCTVAGTIEARIYVTSAEFENAVPSGFTEYGLT